MGSHESSSGERWELPNRDFQSASSPRSCSFEDGEEDQDETFVSPQGLLQQITTAALATKKAAEAAVIAQRASAAASALLQTIDMEVFGTSLSELSLAEPSTPTSQQGIESGEPTLQYGSLEGCLVLWGFGSRFGPVPGEEWRYEAIQRCTQYVVGLGGGKVVGAWHVVSVNDWGKYQKRVLVVCEDCIYRIKFDRHKQLIDHYQKVPYTAIKKIEVDAGGLCMTCDLKQKPGKSMTETLFGWVGERSGGGSPSHGDGEEQPIILERKSRVYFTTVPRNRYMDLFRVTKEIVAALRAAHEGKGIRPRLLVTQGDIKPA
jgi:hypothetical protein